jgi:phosphopantetheinyl transferase
MPITQIIEENNCQIAVWDINESLEKLIQLSNNLDVCKFKTKRRKEEFLSIRLLLSKILPNSTISYNKYGAPEIGNNNFISIAHSKNLAAIIISKNKVGLDIEKNSKKPLILSSKFIAKKRHNPLIKEKAVLIWCCKEAVYKWQQKPGINFIDDIKIMPFTVKQNGSIIAKFETHKLTLHYKKIDTHFLVYVCK